MHLTDSMHQWEADKEAFGGDKSVQSIYPREFKDGIICNGTRTIVNVIKTILYRGRVPAMIGTVIYPSTPTDSLLKETKGMETGLS